MNKLDNLPERLLLGPGPSSVSPNVYKALSKPIIGHLDPVFLDLMEEIKSMLRNVLNTKNELTIPISGTGSAGMETCFVNLVEPNDKVLVLINGVFGNRMKDVAQRLGAQVDSLEFEWGTAVQVDAVKEKLNNNSYDIVAVVHAETSTGVLNPVKEIGELLQNTNTIYLVDGVTSLGGLPVKLDEWRVDAFYSGTQKCLAVPPGLSPISFSQKAVDRLNNRKSKVPNWYLDLSMIAQYWASTRVYHHTAPINMNYALYQALYDLFEEGVENVFARHKNAHNQLVTSLEKLGLTFLVDKDVRLPMLNAVLIPDGIDDASFRSNLLNNHQIEIGGGLGPLAGKIWRIGLMGTNANTQVVEKLVTIMTQELKS